MNDVNVNVNVMQKTPLISNENTSTTLINAYVYHHDRPQNPTHHPPQ